MKVLRYVCLPVIGSIALALALPNRATAADSSDSAAVANPGTNPGYADLVDLLAPAPLVLAVQIRKIAQVEPERAGNVRPGWVRIYVEAQGLAALRGKLPVVPTLSYLADVPLDSRGKLPPLAKHNVLLIARPVTDHPEMLQLVAPDAQLPWESALEMRVRAVLAALQAPDAPSVVTGVREASYVPGTLEGEGETQIFLATGNRSPAAITVVHQPGQPASWSVSFSEVVDASGKPPARETLAWYRLACSLPAELPPASNVSATPEDRSMAVDDYHFVMTGLGACGRAH